MQSPFPGMDPYLEQPAFWSSFHSRLIVAIANAIEAQLSDRYYVDVETRTYQSEDHEDEILVGIPDAAIFSRNQAENPAESLTNKPDELSLESGRSPSSVALQAPPQPEPIQIPMPLEVRERYLEIRELGSDAVITVIEVLSPKNKKAGPGRDAYKRKRRSIFGSQTHLIEIDLLRAGRPMEIISHTSTAPYYILISRSPQRPTADLYRIRLQQTLPSLQIPLKSGDAEPIVSMQDLLMQVFREARYGSRISYRMPVPPPRLLSADQDWVDQLLASLRTATAT